MKERLWGSFVTALQRGQCVLVLGPDVPARPLSPGDDCGGAREVSLREAFCCDLARQLEEDGQKVGERILFAVAQQYADSPSTANLKYEAAAFFKGEGYRPGPLHLQLASLPFSTVLTTCHDGLFADALREAEKDPCRRWYHYQGEPRGYREPSGPVDVQTPLVYHLFGAFDEPTSLVLTENDLLDFIIHVISKTPDLPMSLRSALRNKVFLFFGFGIKHWYPRVLLKLIVRALEDPSGGFQKGSIALESLGGLQAQEREQTVLFYQRGTHIEVVDVPAAEFLDELCKRFQKAGGYLGTGRTPLGGPRVFISYERTDSDVANRLYEELVTQHVEPSLDTQFLQGGDQWSAELEERIEDCDYFLVLHSPNLIQKDVGYVNKELAKALDLQRYRRPGLRFIIPLRVGLLSPGQGRRDLEAFEQMPLREESFPGDVAQLARQIKRDHQIRLHQGG